MFWLWLDVLLYGYSRGLRAPRMPTTYYWVLDRRTERGALYVRSGHFGCQLASFQWRMPAIGEERVLGGRKYTPFRSERRLGRVRVSWATELPKDVTEANAVIRGIPTELQNVCA